MRSPMGIKYVNSFDEARQCLEGLKFHRCPHCGAVGFLIRHGFLRGYDEHGVFSLRGWRVFCSNRFRRKGCGGTFSLVLASVLARRWISASTLWLIARAVCCGFSFKAAWMKFLPSFSLLSGYRLWRRFRLAQSGLRTLLCREKPPPDCFSPNPLSQLLEHFRSVFPLDACPFSAFQFRFQRCLLF